MMRLLNKSRNNQTLVENLEVANTLWTQAKGLLGRTQLDSNAALWITHSGSIHTFFMRFAIDLVFLDKNLVVTKTAADVKPWRLVLRTRNAASVIEFQSGFLNNAPLAIGEQLHVDHTLS